MAARLTLAVAVGLAAGAATEWSVPHLPFPLEPLGNTAAPWILVACAAALTASRLAESLTLAVVTLVALVLGFYVAEAYRGWPVSRHQVEFWFAASVALGPLVGLAAAWLRQARCTRAALGAGVLGGLLAGEAIHGLTTLVRVTVTGGRAQVARLAFEPSPVWWRPFYLTPNSATGSWVVGTFRGDQHDTTDNSRLFAYNGTTRRVQWLTAWAAGNQSPVVDAAKVPDVYYVSGTTVREVSTSAIGDHRIFTAPTGWQITGLTVAGTAAPYVALTHNEGASPLTATTEVEQLTSTPTVVVPITHGTVTALALSPDGRSLAMSLVSPSGGSTLSLRAVAHGGIHRTLPAVGNTTQMSWDTSGDTLAVNPQQWGGTTLVNLTTAMTSYPSALQPYGADVLIP